MITPKTQLRGHLLTEAFLNALYSQSWTPLVPASSQGLLLASSGRYRTMHPSSTWSS